MPLAPATTEVITFEAPSGTEFANPSGAVVTDSTTGASQVVPGIVPTTTKTTDDTVAITTSLPVADSNAMTVTVFGVTNPAVGTYSGTTGFSAYTTADPIVEYAAAYSIGPSVVNSASPTPFRMTTVSSILTPPQPTT